MDKINQILSYQWRIPPTYWYNVWLLTYSLYCMNWYLWWMILSLHINFYDLSEWVESIYILNAKNPHLNTLTNESIIKSYSHYTNLFFSFFLQWPNSIRISDKPMTNWTNPPSMELPDSETLHSTCLMYFIQFNQISFRVGVFVTLLNKTQPSKSLGVVMSASHNKI